MDEAAFKKRRLWKNRDAVFDAFVRGQEDSDPAEVNAASFDGYKAWIAGKLLVARELIRSSSPSPSESTSQDGGEA